MLGFLLNRTWGRALVCAACIYHVGAMITANLPYSTAFGSELRRPFAYYVGYVGLWQNWIMFHTIPHFRALRPKLVARYEQGPESEHGAVMPGLEPYKHRTRLGSLFFRYVWPSNDIEPYARDYLQRACLEVTKQTGKKPKTVTLRLDSVRLQPLDDVKKSRKIGKRAADFSSLNVTCP